MSERKSSRARKQVERFEVEAPKEVEEQTIPEGEGLELGTFDNIAETINKTLAQNSVMLKLYKIALNAKRRPKSKDVKKHLRLFNGFDPATAEGHKKSVQNKLAKFEKKDIVAMMKLCCLRTTGNKSECTERLIAFLEKPSADYEYYSSSAGGRKRKASTKTKKTSTKKKKAKKAAKEEKKVDEAEAEAEAEEGGEEEEESSDSSSDEEGDETFLLIRIRASIKKYLSDEATDLEKMTVKTVRHHLQSIFGKAEVKARKDKIKEMTGEIYEEVTA